MTSIIKNQKHLEAIEKLKARYGFSVSSHSPNYDYALLVSGCANVSCEINDDCFQMGFSQPYGHFYYSKLNVVHIGSASDLAFERCLRLSLGAKKSDHDYFDLPEGTQHNPEKSALIDVTSFYKDLSKRIVSLKSTVEEKQKELATNDVKALIADIPLFDVSDFPPGMGAASDYMHYRKLYQMQHSAINMINEELDAGMPAELALLPLTKMTDAINDNKRVRVRTLLEGLPDEYGAEAEASQTDSEDDDYYNDFRMI